MTSGPHLTQDQLVEHLYCASETVVHLEDCTECRARFLAIEQAHVGLVTEPVPSDEYFLRQRRAVANRIDRSPSFMLGSIWVPATLSLVLAACMLIGRAYVSAPAQPALEETAEALEILEPGWFDETYAVMRVAEPRAASPIVHLFSQQTTVE